MTTRIECPNHVDVPVLGCAPCLAARMRDPRRAIIVQTARRMVGRPYAHMGRGARNGAVDCAGLMLLAFARAGLEVPDAAVKYQRAVTGDFLAGLLAQRGARVPSILDAAPGDVVTLVCASQASHLAVVTDAGTLIHASSRAKHGRRVVEERVGWALQSCVAEVWRHGSLGDG